MNQRLVTFSAFLAAVSVSHTPMWAQELIEPGNDYLLANNALFDVPPVEATDPGGETPEEMPRVLDGPIEPVEAMNTADAKESVQRRLRFQGRVSLRATYDDNIFIQNKNKVSDLIFSVQPGLTVGMGDLQNRTENYLLLDYDANAMAFVDNSSLSSVDHEVALRGQWHGSKLTVGAFFEFQKLTGTSTEVGDRVSSLIYVAGVRAGYQLSERTKFESSLEHITSDYEEQIDSKELRSRSWVDHQVGPRTKIGIGATVGGIEVQQSGTQTYQQALGRINYAAGSKVNATASGGVEFRQFEQGGSQTTPVFRIGAAYTPYDLVTYHIDAYRRVQPSITRAGENTIVTGVSGGVQYRFMQRFEAAATAGYERSTYHARTARPSPSREDDYVFVRPNLSYWISTRWRAGLFYEFRKNNSTRTESSFDNHQTGAQVSVAF